MAAPDLCGHFYLNPDVSLLMVENMIGTCWKVGLGPFFLLMIGVLFLVWLYLQPGIEESPLHLPLVADFGVTVIF